MAQGGSNGEKPAGPGLGRHCPYCDNWFYSTEFLAHMDEEFDLQNLTRSAAQAAS